MASVWSGKGYGFIDPTGKFVIEDRFDDANSFCEGLALVKLKKRYGFVDLAGQIAIATKFTRAGDFSEGLAAVAEEEWAVGFAPRCGYLDVNGTILIQPTFFSAHGFHNGLCLVETKGSIGYINRQGEFVWQGPYVEYGVVL
jgi:hypothetical protein